ncbi:selenide, water dikinase SelD [Larkinella sp. VNQ87]|uniref:selenide, water dikinase SelD n=1 Tax=Larkinella sp. VNQ87 TaxID=3400921 RepID=UPI003BFDF5E3
MIQQTEIYKLAHFSETTLPIQKIVPDTSSGQPAPTPVFPHLLLGPDSAEGVTVLEIGHGEVLLALTDFSIPMTDNPYDFGRIASAQALSRIYAMGGVPLLVAPVLGWPAEGLPTEWAGQVLEGSHQLCAEAGVPLASGHQIESPEPYLGLSVTGKVRLNHLKQLSTATAGNCLYLTKPLGTGILSTAYRQERLRPESVEFLLNQMTCLNTFGVFLGKLPYVKALAPVTDAGLLGALIDLAESSSLSAEIDFHKMPVLPETDAWLAEGCIPNDTYRNAERFAGKTNELSDSQRFLLADPQANGGLLIAIDSGSATEFEQVAFENKLHLKSFGHLIEIGEKAVYVR